VPNDASAGTVCRRWAIKFGPRIALNLERRRPVRAGGLRPDRGGIGAIILGIHGFSFGLSNFGGSFRPSEANRADRRFSSIAAA